MSNFTKINLLSERTSRVPPVIFLKGKTTYVYWSPDQVQTEKKQTEVVGSGRCYPSPPSLVVLFSYTACTVVCCGRSCFAWQQATSWLHSRQNYCRSTVTRIGFTCVDMESTHLLLLLFIFLHTTLPLTLLSGLTSSKSITFGKTNLQMQNKEILKEKQWIMLATVASTTSYAHPRYHTRFESKGRCEFFLPWLAHQWWITISRFLLTRVGKTTVVTTVRLAVSPTAAR